MATAGSSRWSRRFLACSAAFLLVWRVGALVGVPRRTAVALAVFGFVFHAVFGMGYLLVPSYFGRTLAVARAPATHLAVAPVGASLLAVAPAVSRPFVGAVGASAWCLGVALFVGALLWSVRDNLAGRDTGATAEREAHRRTDRFANPFVVVSLAYLAVGSYELLARTSALPGLTDGYAPRVTHLLAAGSATLLVFALGVRLAPRFLGVPAPKPLVAAVLPAGAVGPALVAFSLGDGPAFVAGAAAESVAVVGFAALYALLLVRSDRRRVGFVGVACGVLCGAFAATLGLSFAFGAVTAGGVRAHLELNLLGFLGLAIVGFAVQFFPPSAGRFRGADDRTALAAVGLLAGGVLSTALGHLTATSAERGAFWLAAGTRGVSAALLAAGDWLSFAGASAYAYLLVRLLLDVGARQKRNRSDRGSVE